MTRSDVYTTVTNRIMDALEKGTVPWRKPWTPTGLPFSLSTGKTYRGINMFLLSLMPYGDPRWGTYKAIRAAGGNVRRGEKGTYVVLWKPVKDKRSDDEDATYMLLREYCVFNAEQADGLGEYLLPEGREHEPLEMAESIVYGYSPGPGILFGGPGASYSPPKDLVRCPHPRDFESGDSYYSALFHELVHSTGHEKRLKRIEPALFGTDPYAREELVAEIGASMLCGLAGISSAGGQMNAAYIANWLTRLADDRKLVVTAAAQAQKACDLIVGTTFDEEVAPVESLVSV